MIVNNYNSDHNPQDCPICRYTAKLCPECKLTHSCYSEAAACMRVSLAAYNQYQSAAMPLFASPEAAAAYLNTRDEELR